MDKDSGGPPRARGVAAACAALLAAAPAAAQQPYDATYCEILSMLGHQMAELRVEGLTQRQAAGHTAAMISEAVNSSGAPLAVRRVIAGRLGQASTDILRFVYTVPIRPEDEPFAFRVGVFIYGVCAAGDL